LKEKMSGEKKHKTADDVLRYLKGELSGRERHAFEREMETDPFEKEAMEGLEGISGIEAEEDILSLHARLRKRLARRRRYTIYSIAATVASILIVGTVFLQIHDFNPGSADETLSESELPALSREKGGMEEPLAESVPEVEASPEGPAAAHPEPEKKKAVAAEDDTPVFAEEPAAEEPAAEEPAAEEAGIETGFVAERTDSEPDEIADMAETEPEPVYLTEEIVAVEAAPAQSQAVPAPGARSTASTGEKRGRRDKGGARQMAATEMKAEPLSHLQVSGVVLSAEDMEPLPEAAVTVKGGDTEVLADMHGRFVLPADEDASTTLIASFVGMETREYPVVAGSEVELVMEPDFASLDDVVVVEPSPGYNALKQYIEENIRFPSSDTASSRAVVILKFTLSENGEIRNIEPLRSPGPLFTEEAVRLINEGTARNLVPEASGIPEEVVRLRILFKR
jgi:hypothetical protein